MDAQNPVTGDCTEREGWGEGEKERERTPNGEENAQRLRE